MGDVADYMIVLAMVLPERAPTLFLVDKDAPGVAVNRTPRYMHTFVYEHPEFGFTDVRVGEDAVLGAVGQGYELTRDWFVEERLMIGARAIGAAERALRTATDFATERVQGGGPIVAHQLIQGMIADSVVDIATNRALVHQIASEADHGLSRKLLHAKAAVVKLAASEAAGRVVDRSVQILGGRGYMRENPCERLYRDIRVDRIWEGTSEIQRLIVGNEVAKRGLDGVLAFGGAAQAAAARLGPDERRRLAEAPGVGAAVDHDRRPRHVRAARGGEEGDQRADLLGRAEPAERDAARPAGDRVLAVAVEPLRADRPRRDADRADAVPAPLQREARREVGHGRAAGGGVREARAAAQRAEADEDDQARRRRGSSPASRPRGSSPTPRRPSRARPRASPWPRSPPPAR